MVLGNASGADNSFRSPELVMGAKTISVDEAKALFDNRAVFLDVRNPRLFGRKHIPGAIHLDLKTHFTESAVSEVVSKDQPVVIYCSGIKCSRSYRATEKAVAWGFTSVHYFRGGIIAWKNAAYPMEGSEISSK